MSMERRDFLRIVGAASLAARRQIDPAAHGIPCRYCPLRRSRRQRSIAVGPAPQGTADALWIRKRDLPRVNGFELEAAGRVPRRPVHSRSRRPWCAATTSTSPRSRRRPRSRSSPNRPRSVWSFGEMQALRRRALELAHRARFRSARSPGPPVHLAGFRGKKALVITWASW